MWKIDQKITQTASHATCWASNELEFGGQASRKSYWAKLYTGSKSWPEFEYFCRQASLGQLAHGPGLIPLVDAVLESECQPILVYPALEVNSINHWMLDCSQPPARPIMVWLMRQTVEALGAIHHVGMVHGQVDSNHVLVVRNDYSIRLVGLGMLETVGTMSSLPRHASRFDAPERLVSEFEVSTAADIYSIGMLMIDTLGKQIQDSSLVRAMMAQDPNQRPTAAEVAGLLRELESQLFGQTIAVGGFRGLAA
jgi:serine/threonine protein kinase